MQRIFFFVLILICFTSVGSVTAQVTDLKQPEGVPASVTVSLPTTSKPSAAVSTAEIQIPVNISDVTGLGINALQFNVLFDENVLDFWNLTGCTVSGTIADDVGMSATCNATVPGIIRVSMFGAFPLTGSGTVLFIRLRADASTTGGESTALTFQDLALFSPSFPSLPGVPRTAVDGTVLLFGPTAANASVAGRVLAQDGQAVSQARVTISNINGETWSAIANGFGYFQVDGLPVGQTYVVSTSARRRTFQDFTINLNDNVTDLNIIAEQ